MGRSSRNPDVLLSLNDQSIEVWSRKGLKVPYSSLNFLLYVCAFFLFNFSFGFDDWSPIPRDSWHWCGIRLDVDNRVRLHCRIQSGISTRPPGGLPERLDNYGSFLRCIGFGCGVHTLSARHWTQRARPDDDNRLANVNQSCRSSSSALAIPSSMVGRLEFLQPQVRPSCVHRSSPPLSSVVVVCCTFGPPSQLLMFTVRLLSRFFCFSSPKQHTGQN